MCHTFQYQIVITYEVRRVCMHFIDIAVTYSINKKTSTMYSSIKGIKVLALFAYITNASVHVI